MKKNVVFTKMLVLIISVIMVFTGIPIFADEQSKTGAELQSSSGMSNGSYTDYLQQYKDADSPIDTIKLGAESNITYKTENAIILDHFQDVGKVIRIDGENGEVQWKVDVEKEGSYNIVLNYYPLESKYTNINISISIDGDIPFDEAAKLVLTRSWKNEHEILSDSRGNNICPVQVPDPVWLKSGLHDSEGLFGGNLRFYFSKGSHTFKIISSRADFVISSVEIVNTEPLQTYKEVSSKYGEISDLNAANIIVEGENASLKSDSMLQPVYDRIDPATYPSDPIKLMLNTIGGDRWKQIGQWLAWKVEVPEDGYYKISMRARQNLVNGRNSYRRAYIDGEVKFAEMDSVKFQFANDWYMKTLGDKEPYLFYLTKGVHEIKLEVVPGEMSSVHSNMQDCVYKMNEIYREIIMITGTTPDVYRDYEIEKDIPDLLARFKTIRDGLVSQKEYLEKVSGKRGSSAGLLESLIVQIDSFISKPESIPLRLDKYKANISSLTSWLISLSEQPLEIDYIEVSPANNKLTERKYNIFKKIFFGLCSLIGSFGKNYGIIGDLNKENDAITVWVGMGRDQVQVVKDLVDSDFVPNTGIKVNVNLVQQGLNEATLAGKGPDIAMFVAVTDAINLAVRGALEDLKNFEAYDEISQRFKKEALVPFAHEGGVYGLPCTQSFPMLFYRKDIFNALGIKTPETWNDFYKIAPVIQRKNLDIGIGSDIGTFATLLFQNGGVFLNDKRSETGFNTEEAMNAFTQWTDFFSKYSLPLTYDFLNRFRTGEMPIGIAPYTQYNVLQVTAPEIKGLWDMTMIPATVKADGTYDYSACGGSLIDGCIMFKKVKDKEAAWEFVKWFTSAEVQGKLGAALEARMGPSARYATANVEALSYLPWNQEELSLLYKQWNYVKEIPQIPASYIISRDINNAFRQVIYNYENPRQTLNLYNYDMNEEIKRKRQEFGLDKGR